MKILLLIIFLFPIICFSQNKNNAAPTKPSTTACPDFNNKNKPSNKGDYYRSLRSMKPVKKAEATTYTPPKKETKKMEEVNTPSEKITVLKEKTPEKTEPKEKENNKKKNKRLPARNTTKAHKRNPSACPNF